jgi:hypothetical protein
MEKVLVQSCGQCISDSAHDFLSGIIFDLYLLNDDELDLRLLIQFLNQSYEGKIQMDEIEKSGILSILECSGHTELVKSIRSLPEVL